MISWFYAQPVYHLPVLTEANAKDKQLQVNNGGTEYHSADKWLSQLRIFSIKLNRTSMIAFQSLASG